MYHSQGFFYVRNWSMRVIFLFILLLFAGLAKAQVSQKTVDSIRVAGEIPELAYAVLNSDTVLQQGVIGYHRVNRKEPGDKAKISDLFHLGSNTKAITSVVAAYLVEQVKLSWTTKFFALFPEWRKDANPAFYNMTLSDLLGDRAGIKPYVSGEEFLLLPKFEGSKSEQRRAFVNYLIKNDALPENGQPFNYSNAGYSVAALMLEEASGKTWEQLVAEVLTKMGIRYRFGWPNSTDATQPWGHWVENGFLTALAPGADYRLSLIEPSSDISMSIANYAKFVRLNLSGLRGKDNVLKASSYQYLHYGHDKYAAGWLNVPAKQLSEHAGSAGTFYCYTLINKEKNLAYIVMANAATEKALKGIFELLDKLIKSTEAPKP